MRIIRIAFSFFIFLLISSSFSMAENKVVAKVNNDSTGKREIRIAWSKDKNQYYDILEYDYLNGEELKRAVDKVKKTKLNSGYTIEDEIQSTFPSYGEERKIWIAYKEKKNSRKIKVACIIIGCKPYVYNCIQFLWGINLDSKGHFLNVSTENGITGFINEADVETLKLKKKGKYNRKSLPEIKEKKYPLFLQGIYHKPVFVKLKKEKMIKNIFPRIPKLPITNKKGIYDHIEFNLLNNVTTSISDEKPKKFDKLRKQFKGLKVDNISAYRPSQAEKILISKVKNIKLKSGFTVNQELSSCFPSIDDSRRKWVVVPCNEGSYNEYYVVLYLIRTKKDSKGSKFIVFKWVVSEKEIEPSNQWTDFAQTNLKRFLETCRSAQKVNANELKVYWYIADRLNYIGGGDSLTRETDPNLKVQPFLYKKAGIIFKMSKKQAETVYDSLSRIIVIH